MAGGRNYSSVTIKKLFAYSGNMCAFPDCTNKIIENGAVVGQICHIEAASLGGPRYNATMTDEERQSFPNLILMCSIHNKVIDDKISKMSLNIQFNCLKNGRRRMNQRLMLQL